MTTLEQPTTTLWRPPDATPFEEAQLAAMAFLARYSGRTLDAYRHDLARSFSGRPTTSWPSYKPLDHTSSCTAPRWRSEDSQRRRSTVGSRRCAASTASLTS